MPSPWVTRALRDELPSKSYDPAPEDRMLPSVDGLILPEDMCLGSESRQVLFCGNTLHCSTCDRWLPAFPGSFMAPVHKGA
jgi:hypothetical protein